MKHKDIALIGYSGHSFVALEIFRSMGRTVSAYADREEKTYNPYQLSYLGNEQEKDVIEKIKGFNYFVSVGDNALRKKISLQLSGLKTPLNAVHSHSVVSETVNIGNGVMISAGVIINALVNAGDGVILNTGCIIEHECVIGDYVHIAPGAVLCGNVHVGEGTFIGANAVIRQGITIGKNVIVGAGCVVTKDIADDSKVVGNPQRSL